ncbi:hypothetical protein CAOG_00634 [Capsaspora owczarzaki ATCC 30864]|uniref:Kinetochore protein NDC80 n=1 Tax=Capsaspora owczarzaki (strain ATCC 30864) TaxID=595528 RepID=A0A0D2WHJ3_CAPO3|nr:hypothetical protein CAOG_00634 [Capsaspora owczarzaki ATCC 30864]KJE89085.1 hypothetical protein CAOG_000634 [Capsaspora owczarzaki ATCC 30864]|eukprot:XP_004365505.2 hypothetical protein CAOG_00634 [Capsaspora owczarzaki ATCC 30864]
MSAFSSTSSTSSSMSSSSRRQTLGAVSTNDTNIMRGRASLGASRVSMVKPPPPAAANAAAYTSTSAYTSNTSMIGGMVFTAPAASAFMAKTPTKSGGGGNFLAPTFSNSAKKSSRKSITGRTSIGNANAFLGLGTGAERATQPRTSLSRRSSIFDKPASSIVKDPRPLSDKTYMADSIRNLMSFLTQHGYSTAVNVKMLSSPSVTDFQRMFKFLYAHLDASYPFAGKLEDEIPVLFKRMKYPFTISKSSLFAVGSPHTWPTLLGALSWLVELVTYSMSVDPMACLFPSVGDGFDQELRSDNQIFFEYLSRAYVSFLEGSDNYDDLRAELANTFDARNVMIDRDVERLTQEKDAYLAEIEESRKPSPLEAIEARRKLMVSDKDKFLKYVQNLEQHKVANERKLDDHAQEVTAAKRELDQLHQDRAQLQAQIDAQDMSPADVERITKERQQVDEALRAAVVAREEMERIAWEREMQVTRKIAEMEQMISAYNKLAETLMIIPTDAVNADGVDFEIQLNMNGSNPHSVLNVDVNEHARPALTRLREKFTVQHQLATEQLASCQERLEQEAEMVTERETEVNVLESKAAKIEQEQRAEKEALLHEYKEQSDVILELEQQLKQLRMGANAGLMESERQVKKAKSELDAALAQCDQEKNECNAVIVKTLELVTAHKTRIQERLAQVKSVGARIHREVQSAM